LIAVTCAGQGCVHLFNGVRPVAVHLRGFDGGACLIVADAFGLVVLPVAGGDDRVTKCIIVSTRYAAGGSVRAADSSLGMVAGGQGARSIVSRYAAYIDRAGSSACTGHVARGIAGGENAAGSVKSHHAASEGVDCGGSFKG